MHRRTLVILHLLIVAILFFLISFTYNEWFGMTMQRHQLMQLPAMLLMGMSFGYVYNKIYISDLSWGISALIFVMASIIFWMLPHSIDYAVITPWFNRLMHVHMLIVGFLIIITLRGMIFEVKMLFFSMLCAKLLASGITLRVFNILLCSSFTIRQQKDTGTLLIIFAISLIVFTLFRYLSFPDNKADELTNK